MDRSEKPDIVLVDDKDDDNEKGAGVVRTVDTFRVLGLTNEDAEFYSNVSIEQRKRIIRKVDMRLVPMLALLYLISHLDRSNIGNAKIEGLLEDLNLSGVQYNIALSLFFVPYVLLGSSDDKKISRPSLYLGSLVIVWGIVMTLHGVVQNFGGLVAVRFILGICESGFYPGAVYLASFWYMPRDLATRIACFYCTSALSGAFSGLLAAGIAKLDGTGGYSGWRWIFLLEGMFTVLVGVLTASLLIDSPERSTRWLEPDEIRFLQLQRFIKQGGRFSEEKDEKFNWGDLRSVLTNWRLYLQAYMLLSQSACNYATQFTLPTITKAMGFTNTNAQLMTVPPYICGCLSSIFFAFLSDRFNRRMPFAAIPFALIAIGNIMILSLDGDLGRVGVSLTSIIIYCIGIYPIQPAVSSWAANNLAPASCRAIGVAFAICFGNTGGIIGSYMFLDKEKPSYHTGFGLSLAFGATGLLSALILELSYKWANKQKEKITEDEIRARYTEDDLLRMGHKSPYFKFTL